MKYIGFVALLFFAGSAVAQRYSECKVYQYQGKNVKGKHLVLAQSFNKKGKIVKEIVNGFETYLDPVENESWNLKEDGTYYYRYEDTLLKTLLFVSPVCPKHGCDSVRTTFFYDQNKRLVKELKSEHSTPEVSREGGKGARQKTQFLAYRWEEPEVSLRFYSEAGLCRELRISPRKPLPHELLSSNKASHYYLYDQQKRMTLDSTEYVDDLKGDLRNVTKYKYLADGYEAHCYAFNFQSIDRIYKDAKGRIVEEDERMLGKSAMNSKTLNKYNDRGDIVSSQQHENGKLTTTRMYVYK